MTISKPSSSGEFRRRAVGLFEDGYTVTPIKPGSKRPYHDGWEGWADTQTIEQVRSLAAKANGCGVGIHAKHTPLVDIDVNNVDLAQRLAGLAHSTLGHTCERIGRAPKLGLPYRCEQPFKKLSSFLFTLPGDKPEDGVHRVEILADGQQWVAYHIHPDTGRPYAWPEGELPPHDDLPEITEAAAKHFIERAEAAILIGGGRIKRETRTTTSGTSSSHGQAGTVEAVTSALEHIPNNDVDYYDWVEMIYAIKGALGEDGHVIALDWSASSPKHDDKTFERSWKSAQPTHAGAGTIYYMARQRGWKPSRDIALNPKKAEQSARRERARAQQHQDSPHDPETGEVYDDGLGERMGFADIGWDASGAEASEDAAHGISHDALALEMGEGWADARYVSLFGKWLFFDGSRWLRDELLRHMTRTREFLRSRAAALVAWAEMRGDADLLEACKKASKKMLDAPTVAAVEKLARSNPGQVASVDQWDADPWLLGTPGGTVDLRTGELRPARAEEYITKLAKVTPAAPGTHTSSFDAFLERIFRHDPELVPYMYRVFGYALTGLTTEHVLVFWWGEGGNGKGVLLNTAAHVMGEYATVAAPDLLLETRNERHPTELAMLQGARLVIASEVSRDKAWAEQKLKSLTGGDKITAHYMRQDDFTFIPQFLLVIAGNHKPAFRTVDRAIRRRIQLVPFLQNIPEAERDKDLENKLKEEAPAILRKFIDGCLDWKQQGLNPPASVREASESYLAGEDVLGQWLDERCDQSNRWAEALTGELFADWSTWREANGFKPQSGVAFSKSLDERGFTRGKTSAGDRCFHGLALIGKQGPDRKWEGAL